MELTFVGGKSTKDAPSEKAIVEKNDFKKLCWLSVGVKKKGMMTCPVTLWTNSI